MTVDGKRAALVQRLAELNDELLQRGGAPSYDPVADAPFLSDEALSQAVHQTLHEVLALREWS